jgi:hypothetical protein
MQGMPTLVAVVAILVVCGLLVRLVVVMRRTASQARADGYRSAGEVVVRCGDGHLFTTIWIPLVSFKAVRLGFVRFQYCPVGEHWTFVVAVPDSELTDRERWIADRYHDGRVP